MSRLSDTLEGAEIHDHLCLIYRSQTEEFAGAIPFMKAGIKLGDQCVYVADQNTAHEVIAAMSRAGINAKAAIANGQLVVATKQEAYLKPGYFDPEWAVNFFEEAANAAKAQGYRALRGNAEMTWQLGGDPGNDRVIEYEAKLAYFFPAHNVLGLCQYNAELFSAETIRDVLFTHPKVIIGGLVCKNFYYKAPEEVLHPDAKSDILRMINNLYEFEKAELQLESARRMAEQANDILEAKVRERTSELEHALSDLKDLNRIMVGREYRIRELQTEVAMLRTRLARGAI